MALPDPNFIACFPLQEYFVNKDTGAALSAGVVYFWADQAFTVPKNVYKQTYLPDSDTYTYTNLGAILTLTSVGTFADDDGNDIIPFLFPYEGTPEEPGEVELYFIEVYSSGAVLQFTRDGWPPNLNAGTNPIDTFEGTSNLLNNPQFVNILFDVDPTSSDYAFSVTGTDTLTLIAPDWYIVTTGTGTVTIKQVALDLVVEETPAPDENPASFPSNPPYALDINSTGVTAIALRQRLLGSPRLLFGEFLNGTFIARGVGANPIVNVGMTYQTTGGTEQTIIATSPTVETGLFTYFNNTIEIPAESTTDAPTGYVDIDITLNPLEHVQITSAQIIGVQNANSSAPFLQQSVAQQENGLFHYYNPQLQFKPIPSLLTGWDFPLNPAQFSVGATQTISQDATIGEGAYVWDQTIAGRAGANVAMIRSATSGGAQFTTGSADDAFYLLQYLTGAQAQKILGTRLSVNVNAYKGTVGTSVTCRVYLFRATAAATLPTLAPIIGTMATTGVFTLVQAGWTPIPRSGLGLAIENLKTVTNANDINSGVDYGFNGWEITDSAEISDTDKFAIIVTFQAPTSATIITVNSISLIPGDIATRPAPQTRDEVLRECQYYYEPTFLSGATIPSAVTTGQLTAPMQGGLGSANNAVVYANTFGGQWRVQKRITPTVVFYSGTSTTAGRVEADGRGTSGGNPGEQPIATFWSTPVITTKNYYLQTIGGSAGALTGNITNTGNVDPISGWIYYHYVSDARLGIV